jgi:ribosome-associated protein
MNNSSLSEIIIKNLEDKKIQDIVSVPSTPSGSMFVIASGTSTQHVRGVALELQRILRQEGISSTLEGTERAEWILIDIGSIIVHLFKPDIRSYYDLEGLYLR